MRLVVADQSYGDLTSADPMNTQLRVKFAACRSVGQLIFGYVYGAGGTIPLVSSGQPCVDPATNQQIRCVGEQILTWSRNYGHVIDGIYVDVGPTDCYAPTASNYADYVACIGHSHICAESGRILLHFLEDKSAREVGTGPGRLSSVTESMPTVVPVSARNPGYDTPGPEDPLFA